MRVQTHDAIIQFRANARLVETAARRAQQQGMSLSEFLRHALRRELKEAA